MLTVERFLASREEYVMPSKAPSYSGTWVMSVGAPGGGKTHDATSLAVKASIMWRLPLLAQDITGNVRARLDGFKQQARADIAAKQNVARATLVLEQLNDAEVYTSRETGELLERVNQVIDIARESKVSRWRAIVLLDEGAIIREYDDTFMKSVAPLFRNAGMLGYVTMQRDVGGHPALRACVRATILYPGAGEYTKHLGFEVPAGMELTSRDKLVYRYNNEFREWNRVGNPPLELITPGVPSNPIPERV
jgi:hypothetical protein